MNFYINDQKAKDLEKDFFLNFHGHSTFTTLRSKNGELLLWPLHWQRLKEQAHFFGYPLPKETQILARLHEEALLKDCKFRVILGDSSYAITSEEYVPPPEAIYLGVKVFYSSITIHPLLGQYKTGNYLPYALAQKEAASNNAFEALLCDQQGFLVDGARTSLMMIKDQTIYALLGGLKGTMREHVLSWARAAGIKSTGIKLRPEEIDGALLLANSLMGVVPVDKVRCKLSSTLVEKFRM